MGSQGSPFIERLPLELRRKIYEDVLKYEETGKLLKPSTSNSCPRFNISLFMVNRTVSRESREVFFEANAVHVCPDQLSDFIRQHGRHVSRLHIEERDADSSTTVIKFSEAAAKLLNNATRLPKLKIVTFECTNNLRLTIRQLVQRMADQSPKVLTLDASKLYCSSVGNYILPIAGSSQEWRFSYSLLSDLWDTWSTRQKEYELSPQDVEDYFSIRGAIRIPRWIFENGHKRSGSMKLHNVYGLESQIRCYTSIERTLPSLKPQTAQIDVLQRFELIGNWKIKKPVLHRCIEFAGRVSLREVRHEHGPLALEWATELLAPNTKDFAAGFGQSSEEAEKYVSVCKSW